MIPDEAVEAAAKAQPCVWSIPEDSHPLGEYCQRCRDRARVTLEAAADILRAEGWDAYESASFEIRLTEDGKNWEPFKVNPYRSEA